VCNEDGILREPTLDERRTLLQGKYEEERGSGGRELLIVGRRRAKTPRIFADKK